MNRDLTKIDERVRDGVSLLREISESKALDSDEREQILQVVSSFDNRLKNIKVKLGIIGEFNSGKSTLINSILGLPVSATGDRPCTSVPVYIQESADNSLAILLKDGNTFSVGIEEYLKYTTEGEAPENIATITAKVNSSFLRENGVVLIDTPGINAIDPEHTRITTSVLAEMHAAILLMYSKQPGSKSTIEFLKQVSGQVSKIFVCVSKSDFLNQEQLNRIITELPTRLTKASGVQIDCVWPIHITESGGGEDFQQFLAHVKEFMLKEWYEIVAKDLGTVLAEYSMRVSEIVANRLLVQERLFYSYMESKPTDFSFVSRQIVNDVLPFIEETFKDKELKLDFQGSPLEVCRYMEKIKNRIRQQLEIDLKSNDPILGFIDRRVDAATVNIATDNLTRLFGDIERDIREPFERMRNSVVQRLRESSQKSLASVNGTFSAFERKVQEILSKSSELIALASKRAFSRALKLPAGTLGSFLFLILCTYIPGKGPWVSDTIWMLIFISCVLTVVSIPYAFKARECPSPQIVNEIVRERMDSFERLEVPSFDFNLSQLSTFRDLEGTKDLKDWNSRFTLGQSLGVSSAMRMGGVGAAIAFAGVIKAVDYLSAPSAKAVAKEMISRAYQVLDEAERSIVDEFDNTKTALQETVKEYTNSLYSHYKTVLDEAFNQNRTLLDSLESTIRELALFSTKLSEHRLLLETKGKMRG